MATGFFTCFRDSFFYQSDNRIAEDGLEFTASNQDDFLAVRNIIK